MRPSQLARLYKDSTRGSTEPAGRAGKADGEGTVGAGRRWLKVAEYAREANVSPQTVRDQLRTGRLQGRKFKGRWRVRASALNAGKGGKR